MTQPAIATTHVRAAEAQDAGHVYDLLVDGFGDRYLPYTIFRPPQSVTYLKRLIEQGLEQSGHLLCVSMLADRLTGFYDAVLRRTDFFLNYIAVAQTERGNGIGQGLLAHFEAKGRFLGCQKYVLDVFESNTRACRWYLNQGYSAESASYHVRMLTANELTKQRPDLLIAPDDLQRALAEEQTQGFSKVDGVCGSGRVTVGLIDGRVCKLLGHSELGLVEAVASIGARFCSDRTILIVPSLSEVPSAWPILDYEKTLRLTKMSS